MFGIWWMRTNLSLSQGIMWAVAADFATGTQPRYHGTT